MSLVHALIASRLDYCNSVLYRINTSATEILQSFLHSAARLIVRKQKFDSITPTIRDDLHWLPVPQRIDYKLCHLQVLASDCSGVPSRLVRASLNHRQSPLPEFSCSWWLTSPGNQNCYFRAPQLRFECPKTLEQPTTATPRFDTDT